MKQLSLIAKVAVSCVAVFSALALTSCGGELVQVDGQTYDIEKMTSYEMPNSSMEPTLYQGETIFVTPFEAEKHRNGTSTSVNSDVSDGDVVAFYDPVMGGRILIKRVVAVEGETVDIRDGDLVVDGVIPFESFTERGFTERSQSESADITYPYEVPSGHVFVLGDNRVNSQDSRDFGSIPVDSIVGIAEIAYSPAVEDYVEIE